MPASNIGLCLGDASGLLAIDYDIDVHGLHSRIEKILPKSPCIKRGAKGYTAFYRYSNQRSASYKSEGVTVLDVLGSGKQTVLPPSVHPDGMEYAWDGPSLLDINRDDLPEIAPEAMAEVIRLFRGPQEERKYEQISFSTDDDVERALSHVSAEDYDTWVRIGMALKDGGHAFGLWDRWSGQSSKYPGAREAQKKWDSFNREGLHIETVFYEAIQAGFKPEPKPIPLGFQVTVKSGGNMRPVAPPIKEDFLTNIPGLPGLISEHINATAGFQQPLLSLAAALATAGGIMANKVETETGLRSNVYILGLGESSSGKDHARQAMKTLLHECGMGRLEMGLPKSGTALIRAVSERGGVAVSYIDEFGHLLGKLTGKHTQSHEREITPILLELYSSAGSVFHGPEFANHDGKTATKVIPNPCLSLYPVTTPQRFYAALTSTDILDGFISRFMVFESNDFPIEWDRKRKLTEIPSALRNIIETWKERGISTDNMVTTFNSDVVPFSDKARDIFSDYVRKNRAKAQQVLRADEGTHAVYGRMGDNAMRLALIAHEGNCIDEDVALWAIRVTDYCAALLLNAIAHKIADTDTERQNKEIVAYIRGQSDEKKTVSRSQIAMKFRKIERRTRQAILDDLVESGAICEGEAGDGKKKAKIYFCD